MQEKINRIVNSDNPDDFLEYAAIVANCGLVITTDTTVAHLSASMGTKTWILLPKDPDWRWGMHGSTSFWYPSVQLFRQRKRNNWDVVMKQVTIELENYFSQGKH